MEEAKRVGRMCVLRGVLAAVFAVVVAGGLLVGADWFRVMLVVALVAAAAAAGHLFSVSYAIACVLDREAEGGDLG